MVCKVNVHVEHKAILLIINGQADLDLKDIRDGFMVNNRLCVKCLFLVTDTCYAVST